MASEERWQDRASAKINHLGSIVVTAQSQIHGPSAVVAEPRALRGSRMQEPEPEPSDRPDRYKDYKSNKEMRPPPPAQPRRCRRCDRVAPGKRHYCCTACKERRVTGGAVIRDRCMQRGHRHLQLACASREREAFGSIGLLVAELRAPPVPASQMSRKNSVG